MEHRLRLVCAVLAALSSSSFAALTAQGRGRGRSEEVKSRVGCYFSDAALAAPEGAASASDRLAKASFVTDTAAKQHLALVYVFDKDAEPAEHELFERTLFNDDRIGVALRCFDCGRIDLATDDAAKAELGQKAPLFVAFDGAGKVVGEVSMRGYKASGTSLEKLLEKAAKGHAKRPLEDFVKSYRAFVNDFEVLEGKKRGLEDRRARLADETGAEADAKRAKLDKEGDALAAELDALLATETELLKTGNALPRDEKAKRLGERADRGGR